MSHVIALVPNYSNAAELRLRDFPFITAGPIYVTADHMAGGRLLTKPLSVAAPTLWNNLPLNIRQSPNLSTFKSNVKTFLFKTAFN